MNINKQNRINQEREEMEKRAAIRELLQKSVDAGTLSSHEADEASKRARLKPYENDPKSPMPHATNVNVVWQTTDYESFHLMEEGMNRNVDHWRTVARNMASKGVLVSPIIVNADMEIIDGQNRFMALRSLGLPVQYIIVSEYGIGEVRRYNTASKNWTKNDFIKSYAVEGNGDYRRLKKFMDEYPDLPKSVLQMIAMGSYEREKSQFAEKEGIIGGHFVFEDERNAREMVKNVMAYKSIPNFYDRSKPVYKNSVFCRALLKIIALNPDFDNARLVRNAMKSPDKLYVCSNVGQTCEVLMRLYNFGQSKKVTLKC